MAPLAPPLVRHTRCRGTPPQVVSGDATPDVVVISAEPALGEQCRGSTEDPSCQGSPQLYGVPQPYGSTAQGSPLKWLTGPEPVVVQCLIVAALNHLDDNPIHPFQQLRPAL